MPVRELPGAQMAISGRDPTRFERLEPGLRRERAALTLVFLVLGGLIATWAARVPAVKAALRLSAGSLGLALLGSAVGLVVSTFLTGALLSRLRPRPVIAVGVAVFAASLPFVALTGGTASLFAVLMAWGVGAGMIDVAMNTEAAALQDRAGRPIMSGLHASFSLGALCGAGLGSLAAATGLSVGWHFLAAGVVTGVVGLGAAVVMPGGAAPQRRAPVERRRHLPAPSRGLVALAVVAFACFLTEGAIDDWSAVYLHGSLGSSVGFAALGYTVFAVTMTIGRLVGDRLSHSFGPVRLVRASTLVAAVGFATTLVAASPAFGLVGFGVLGLGMSFVGPGVFSAAGALGKSGPSLAAVTGCGYVGFMAGPPLIGGLADVASLPAALTVVVVLTLLISVLAGSLAPGSSAAGFAAATGAAGGTDGGSST